MRPLVQEPRKTASTLMSSSLVPGLRSMYSSARVEGFLVGFGRRVSGEGTVPSMVATMPGDVPQVTVGTSFVASMLSSRSKVAPGSVTSERQCSSGGVSPSCLRLVRARSGGL